jgi:hemolysin-activating ACP:hemolysin acyltransferase
MWGKRRETQVRGADSASQSEAAVSAEAAASATEALSASPEPVAPPSPPAEAPAAEQAAAAGEAAANGVPGQTTSPVPGENEQAFWRGKLAAAHLAGAVSLFLRSPAHRHYTLADLEWSLLPALALGQFMTAETQLPDGQAVPVAMVLWAKVSAEVDARLSSAPRYPIRLHPNEWRSGEVIWIVDAVGEPKALQHCVEGLAKTAFGGQPFKRLTAVQRESAVSAREAN